MDNETLAASILHLLVSRVLLTKLLVARAVAKFWALASWTSWHIVFLSDLELLLIFAGLAGQALVHSLLLPFSEQAPSLNSAY